MSKKKEQPANKPFNAKALAAAVIKRRTDDDLSLNAAAAQTGLTKMTMFRVETVKSINLETLVTLCNWLGVSVQTFF